MGSRNREVVNRLQETKRQAEKLKSDLEARRSEVEDELEEIWRDCGLKNRLGRFGFQVCRTLQGRKEPDFFLFPCLCNFYTFFLRQVTAVRCILYTGGIKKN